MSTGYRMFRDFLREIRRFTPDVAELDTVNCDPETLECTRS